MFSLWGYPDWTVELTASSLQWSLNPAPPGGILAIWNLKSVQLVLLNSSLSLSPICRMRTLTVTCHPGMPCELPELVNFWLLINFTFLLAVSVAQRTSSHHIVVQPNTCSYRSTSLSTSPHFPHVLSFISAFLAQRRVPIMRASLFSLITGLLSPWMNLAKEWVHFVVKRK